MSLKSILRCTAVAMATMTAPLVSSFVCRGLSPRCSGASGSDRTALFENAPDGGGGDAVGTLLAPAEVGQVVSVSRPLIHWTVPGFKIGWQDSAGEWHDEDGPRKGPPLNFWRQNCDQREYNSTMQVVDAVLSEGTTASDDATVEERVRRLESRASARRPSLSRKVLGRWAPLMLGGQRVARGEGDGVEAPFVMDVRRSAGRRFGPKNHYGVFDLILEDGEGITVSAATGDAGAVASARIAADGANGSADVGTVVVDGRPLALRFGGVTCASDYVLVRRDPDGAIDLFLRADESYLGATEEELAAVQES